MRRNSSLVLLLILSACGNNNSSENPWSRFGGGRGGRATPVETVTVKSTTLFDQVNAFGNVRTADVVNVTPQLNEVVEQLFVEIGDTVRAGETLATLRKAALIDQLERDKAQLEQAKIALRRDSLSFRRAEKLFEQNLGSEADLQVAQAAYETSQFQLKSAMAAIATSTENLRRTKIIAPVDGVITTRNIAKGSLASSGQAAFELATLSGYEIRVFLPLQDWRKAKMGQQVRLRYNPDDPFVAQGYVSRVNPRLDPQTGLGEVVVVINEGTENVYPGVLCQAIVNVNKIDNTIAIPRAALLENVQTILNPESNTIQLERTYSVFTVIDDTLAIRRTVKTGLIQGDMIQILEGIQPGDQIITTGQSSLEDSAKVRIPGKGGRPGAIARSDSMGVKNPGDPAASQRQKRRKAPADSAAAKRANSPSPD